MGSVYLAHDTVLDRPVAIKFIGHVRARRRRPRAVPRRGPRGRPDPAPERDGDLPRRRARGPARTSSPSTSAASTLGELERAAAVARGARARHRPRAAASRRPTARACCTATSSSPTRCSPTSGEVKLLDFGLAKLIDAARSTRRAAARANDADAAATSAVERTPATAAPHRPHGRDVELRDARRRSAAARPDDRPAPMPPRRWSAAHRGRRVADAGRHAARHAALHGARAVARPSRPRAGPTSTRSACCSTSCAPAARRPRRARRSSWRALSQESASRGRCSSGRRASTRGFAGDDRPLPARATRRRASPRPTSCATRSSRCSRAAASRRVPEGNPYRGLQAFEAEHRALFFGRGAEIRAVVERLRAEPFVLVAGDSGVGKSSLCRAGVLPLVERGRPRADGAPWASRGDDPGPPPAADAGRRARVALRRSEEAAAALIAERARASWSGALRRSSARTRGLAAVHRPARGAGHAERRRRRRRPSARCSARIAAGAAGPAPAGDGARRLPDPRRPALPALGDELSRARSTCCAAVARGRARGDRRPGAVKGVRFESEALVDELVERRRARAACRCCSSRWPSCGRRATRRRRDHPAAALDEIGGVTGALARHADARAGRAAARPQRARRAPAADAPGHRRRHPRGAGPRTSSSAATRRRRAALEALVRGAPAWSPARPTTARGLRDRPRGADPRLGDAAAPGSTRSARRERSRHRLELAAAEWERLGRSRDALWSGRRCTRSRGSTRRSLRPHEREFIAACKAAAARVRALKRGAIVLRAGGGDLDVRRDVVQEPGGPAGQGRRARDRGGAGAHGRRQGARRRRGAADPGVRGLRRRPAGPRPTGCGPATRRRCRKRSSGWPARRRSSRRR